MKIHRFTLLYAFFVLNFSSTVLPAAESTRTSVPVRSASISGRVRNLATGAYLEGAVVTLEPGHQTTLTARDGSYHFSALPPAVYQISASYTGLDTRTLSAELATGAALTREIELTAQIYAMDAFTVAGLREGNALAVTQQRNAANVKNVISADAFGNIADQNIGDLLMRIPGVVEAIDEGQVSEVTIRGITSDMNAVTVDGTRAASGHTAGFQRGYNVDRVPADFVERIEVTKALTPDMDGDSIGGAINLRTKSPLDRKGRTLSYMGGASWNLDRNTFHPIGSLLYSNTFGPEEKLGVLVTSSYNKTFKPRDSIYQNWQTTAATDVPAYFWLNNVGEDRLEHERMGVGVRVDYKLTPTHRVFVNTMYSDYNDILDRRQITMSPTINQVRPGWTNTVTETFNHNVTLTQNYRERSLETINVVVGGEKRFETSLLDYGANFSPSKGAEQRVIPTGQATAVGFRFDRSGHTKFPTMTQTSGVDLHTRTDHRLTALTFQDFDDEDQILGAHLNWKKKMETAVPTSVKTGLRYRGQERAREQEYDYYSYVGPDGIAGRNAATGINDDNVGQFADLSYDYRSARGRYDPVPIVDRERLVQFWRDNPAQFPENIANTERDSRRFDGKMTEDIFAAYLMGDVRLGRLDILAGVRVEKTHVTSHGVGQEITAEERARRLAWVGTVTPAELRRRTIAEWSNPTEDTGSYRNVLPGVHFKYHLLENMIARASYSTGIGRPNYDAILRNTTVNHDNMTVVAANPNLRPQTADNFDMTLEYYFEPAGYLSASVFLKEIHDFIYGDRGGVVGAGANNGFNGDYEGYELISNFNGGGARVRGVELAYSQRFTWLPGVWKGLGITANYTKLESQGSYSASEQNVSGTELAGFVPEIFNSGISYSHRSWDIQLKMLYRSSFLSNFNANPLLRLYRYSRTNYDINLKYNWKPSLSFFMDVINIFNDPIDDRYIYVDSRPRQTQLFTPAIKAGISGRF